MSWNLHGTHAREGDLAQLVGLRYKNFIFTLKAGEKLHTHRGIVCHDDLIGKPWGSRIYSHKGSPFFLLQPALGEVLRALPRNTQIMYPKDIGFILINMGIGPGQVVVEAGTGSGSFTTALAYAVGDTGHVYSYERKKEPQELAGRNLKRLGLEERVTFKARDIEEGFDEEGIDALFLDVNNPCDYIPQVRKALKPGGFFGSIQPTTNQVSTLIHTLRMHGFAFIETVETMVRYYKCEPGRFRPVDRMVAHTGYLVFARPLVEITSVYDLEESMPEKDAEMPEACNAE